MVGFVTVVGGVCGMGCVEKLKNGTMLWSARKRDGETTMIIREHHRMVRKLEQCSYCKKHMKQSCSPKGYYSNATREVPDHGRERNRRWRCVVHGLLRDAQEWYKLMTSPPTWWDE